MELLREKPRASELEILGSVITVKTLRELDIDSPGHVGAKLWNRRLTEDVHAWLEDLPAAQLPHGRFVLKAADVSECMQALFKASGAPEHSARDWLCEDAGALAQHLSHTLQTTFVRLRLETISDNACAKFHLDHVTARLICTYRGPGTQVAEMIGVKKFGPVHQVGLGAPILLKGSLSNGAAENRLRHRSPPIAGKGVSRLMLALEGVAGCSENSCYDQEYLP